MLPRRRATERRDFVCQAVVGAACTSSICHSIWACRATMSTYRAHQNSFFQ
nr:MAG TPA: hypothetical protein [Caudoviricetes sp.]